MAWKDDKNLGSWGFTPQPNKPSYNEGDHISTYASPLWSMAEGSNIPITPTHSPCGYWTKNYVPSPPPFTPPDDPYLIGWYKFDDGSGSIVNNYAEDGSLGGGLLPDLTVVNVSPGSFWTYKTGFGSTATLQPASTDFAWVDLGSTRTYGGSAGGYACYGIFYCRFSTTTGGCACSLYNDNVGTVSTGTEFDVGTNIGALYRSEAGWRSNAAMSTYIFATATWYFLFIDSTGYFYVVKPDGTLVSIGSINVAMATAVALRYLHAGVRYDIPAPDYGRSGCYGSYGDWIIYNFTRLTLAEWAEWYDNLHLRYGMAARSGW